MKVLFLTHRLPYAPNRGDRIRSYYLLRELSRFAEVTLFSLVHEDDEERRGGEVPFARSVKVVRVPRLRNLMVGAARVGSSRPLTHSLLDAPGAREALKELATAAEPDLVFAYCSGMARFAMEPPLAPLPFVLDMVDVDSAKWSTLASQHRGPRSWIYRREATTLAAFERAASRGARTTLVVNERERDALLSVAPGAAVQVLENGVDVAAFAAPGAASAEPTVTFCGVLDYYPNEEGVVWFAREVWPAVAAQRRDARFLVVGANPTERIKALAARDPSIEVTGRVDSVQPCLWKSAVSVSPLRFSRGLQNKALEALAAGLPVVATSLVVNGLPRPARPGCVVADTANAFARAILDLLERAPEERRRRAAAADLTALTWEERFQPLEAMLRSASITEYAGRSTDPVCSPEATAAASTVR